LVGAELVEVVVGGGVLERRLCLREAHRRVLLGGQRLPLGRGPGPGPAGQQRRAGRARHQAPGDEAPPVEIEPPRRDLRALESISGLDQHIALSLPASPRADVSGLSNRALPSPPTAGVREPARYQPLGRTRAPEFLPPRGKLPPTI